VVCYRLVLTVCNPRAFHKLESTFWFIIKYVLHIFWLAVVCAICIHQVKRKDVMDLEIRNCKTPVRGYTYLPSVKVENCDCLLVTSQRAARTGQLQSKIYKPVISMKLKWYSRGPRDCLARLIWRCSGVCRYSRGCFAMMALGVDVTVGVDVMATVWEWIWSHASSAWSSPWASRQLGWQPTGGGRAWRR
jgi:hypothetical protein